MKGKTATASITIQTVRPNWSREITLKLSRKATIGQRFWLQHPQKTRQSVRKTKERGLELDTLDRTKHKTTTLDDELVVDGRPILATMIW